MSSARISDTPGASELDGGTVIVLESAAARWRESGHVCEPTVSTRAAADAVATQLSALIGGTMPLDPPFAPGPAAARSRVLAAARKDWPTGCVGVHDAGQRGELQSATRASDATDELLAQVLAAR